MTDSPGLPTAAKATPPWAIAGGLGLAQTVGFGTTTYFLVIYSEPLRKEMGWDLSWVMAGLTVAFLVWAAIAGRVGLWIREKGGKPALCLSTFCFAAGLLLIGVAHSIPVYLLAWAVIGVGMGTGLYDVVFATLGRLYGIEARRPITTVTLVGGFSSTIFWPIAGLLVSLIGWRWTSVAFAAVHLLVSLPIYLKLLPDVAPQPQATAGAGPRTALKLTADGRRALIALACVAVSHVTMSSIIALNMMDILKSRGLSLAAAIALSAVIGPAQVASRLIETVLARRYHPSATMLVAMFAMASSSLLLVILPTAVTVVALVILGIGMGLYSVARGALPIYLYGRMDSAVVGARIGRYVAITQAAVPLVGAWLVTHVGLRSTLEVLVGVGVVGVSSTLALRIYGKRLGVAND